MELQNKKDKTSYLSFGLNKENFLIDVTYVLEIIELPTLTLVPNSSKFVKGVLNYRGEIVPVIDMHKRFNLNIEEDESQKMTIIINLQTENSKMHLGLMVDRVTSVIDIEFKDIRNVPEMGIKYDMEFLQGMVDLNEDFLMILNVEKVIQLEEFAKSEVALESNASA